MKHREAIEHLPGFAEGGLPSGVRGALRSHVRGCPECQRWLETYGLLADVNDGGGDSPAGSSHPDSVVLALCAVRPDEVREPDRDGLREHLARCERCRVHLELLQAALAEARPAVAPGSPTVGRPEPDSRRRGRVAAAAAIVAILAPLAVYFGLGVLSPRDGRLPDPAGEGAPAVVQVPVHGGDEISGTDIEGTHLIESDRDLTLTHVKVRDGAAVTIHSSGRVALGDGFAIGSNTKVSVGGGSRGASTSVRSPSAEEEI